MIVQCCHCGTDLDPSHGFVHREVIGWEPSRKGKTGAVTAKQPTGRFACDDCWRALKAKLAPGQGALL